MTHVVMIGRLYTATNREPRPLGNRNTGWRPVVWAKRLIDAEKFSDRSSAHLWAKTWLEHDDFVVVSVGAEEPQGVA